MRTALLSALMLLAAPALADSVLPADAPVLAAAPATPAAKAAANTNDEDEDEAPKPAAPAPAATTAPAAAPMGAVSTTPSAGVDQQKLVSGAPLYNPNVAVHIVEKKEYSDRNRIEVVVDPGVIQINGKITQHYGIACQVLWHLQENFALMVMGIYNYVAEESQFNNELINKAHVEAQTATSLLLNGGIVGGVEATPFYGKWVWFDTYLVHFSLVLSGGAGAGSTRHQLKPLDDCSDASSTSTCYTDPSYGYTGWRFMAEIGGGFRIQIGKWIAIRLELRDLLYTARVDHVDGCNTDDLHGAQQDLDHQRRQPEQRQRQQQLQRERVHRQRSSLRSLAQRRRLARVPPRSDAFVRRAQQPRPVPRRFGQLLRKGTTMKSLIIAALLVSNVALAQDLGLYNRALSSFNAGSYDDSAQLFFEVNNSTTDPDIRMKSEYYLAASFQKLGMPVAAFIYFDTILRAGKTHPYHLKAVEGLVNVQDALDDQYLIPSVLN